MFHQDTQNFEFCQKTTSATRCFFNSDIISLLDIVIYSLFYIVCLYKTKYYILSYHVFVVSDILHYKTLIRLKLVFFTFVRRSAVPVSLHSWKRWRCRDSRVSRRYVLSPLTLYPTSLLSRGGSACHDFLISQQKPHDFVSFLNLCNNLIWHFLVKDI